MSDVTRRSETKVERMREGLMREVMAALLVMNLSQSKEVKRIKPVKKTATRNVLQFVDTRRGNKQTAVVTAKTTFPQPLASRSLPFGR
jgi:hypothetical protein